MTPDDMDFAPQPDDQSLDDRTVDAILGGVLGSGDTSLDETLSALRGLGESAPPEPNAELASYFAYVGSAGPTGGGDELRRRRQGRARHIATGTTAVAGILLVTATAAAALGTLRGERVPARPTLPPAVVVHPSTVTPHPVTTVADDLPSPSAPGLGVTEGGAEDAATSPRPGSDRRATVPSLHTRVTQHGDADGDTDDESADEPNAGTTAGDHGDDRSDDHADDETSGPRATEPSDDDSSSVTGDDGAEDDSTGTHDDDDDDRSSTSTTGSAGDEDTDGGGSGRESGDADSEASR